MTEQQALKAGYRLVRGSQKGTADDRADRYYWDAEGCPVDHGSDGFCTKAAALQLLSHRLAARKVELRRLRHSESHSDIYALVGGRWHKVVCRPGPVPPEQRGAGCPAPVFLPVDFAGFSEPYVLRPDAYRLMDMISALVRSERLWRRFERAAAPALSSPRYYEPARNSIDAERDLDR